jgi:hypothetical protein
MGKVLTHAAPRVKGVDGRLSGRVALASKANSPCSAIISAMQA